MKKLVVVNGGMSNPSTTRMLAERIAEAVSAQVSKRGEGLDISYVDVADIVMDLATAMSTGIYNERLRADLEQVAEADALIAATPVFKASYSGIFKMFFDALDNHALTGVPVLIAATAGTARHSLVLDYALRPLFNYLRAITMPTAIFAATDDFGQKSDIDSRITRAARELAQQIVDVSDAVVGFGPDFGESDDSATPKRESTNTTVNTNVTDFATLLAGHDGTAQKDH